MHFNEIKFVPKSWGYEKWLVNNDLYCSKILFVAQNKFCSWHYHKVKTETFYILEGRIKLTLNDSFRSDDPDIDLMLGDSLILSKGESINIPVGARHRFTAIEDSLIIETSTHHEDSDSIRLLPSCELD